MEEPSEGSAMQIQLPDEIKLVVKILDDCTKITKPFLTAQAALEGMKIKTEGTTANVGGTLMLQLDGFDGSRGQSLPLLELGEDWVRPKRCQGWSGWRVTEHLLMVVVVVVMVVGGNLLLVLLLVL